MAQFVKNTLKVGDKVKIKSFDWFGNKHHISIGEKDFTFVKNMSIYCGATKIIKEIYSADKFKTSSIVIRLEGNSWFWHPWMFEE